MRYDKNVKHVRALLSALAMSENELIRKLLSFLDFTALKRYERQHNPA
jgi:hypothetical protein